MNKVWLTGRLGRDLQRTKNGKALHLALATNERKKDGVQWVKHTEWHRITCFGALAERCEKYLNKGSLVSVEGKLETSQWQPVGEPTKYELNIIGLSVEFLGKGQGGSHANQSGQCGNYSGSSNDSATTISQGLGVQDMSFDDDEIPF